METVDSAYRDILGRKSDFTSGNENFKYNKYNKLKVVTRKNAKNLKKVFDSGACFRHNHERAEAQRL